VIIVSSGMEPIIRAVLEKLLPSEDAQSIPIIANNVRYTDAEKTGKTWEIIYRHPESGFGHDKSKAILPYRDLPHKPTLFFCGDGVSGQLGSRVPTRILMTRSFGCSACGRPLR
jgi:2-hydroxy-3-keto-5-methylthiopentenyl-1-phosphate phosphatase